MKARYGLISLALLLGLSAVPVHAAVCPDAHADKATDTLALLPGVCRPSAVQAPRANDEEADVTARLSRVTGEVVWSVAGTDHHSAVADTQLPQRVAIKTGKSSWCEVQIGKTLVRCWHNTDCVVDTANQAVHLKSGSVIVRKSGEGEMLLTAAGQTLLLESGVARVEVANGVARIFN